jgi:hypothetical protein
MPDYLLNRPASVTYLAVGVLITAGFNLLRFWNAYRDYEFLSGLLPFSPLYLVLGGLFWGLTGLVLFYGLWLGKQWAPDLTRIAAFVYTLYFWLDRIFLTSLGIGVNWLFVLIVNIIILILVLWILNRDNARRYFGDIHV